MINKQQNLPEKICFFHQSETVKFRKFTQNKKIVRINSYLSIIRNMQVSVSYWNYGL